MERSRFNASRDTAAHAVRTAFIPMQMAFGAAADGPVWFEIVGFTLFIVVGQLGNENQRDRAACSVPGSIPGR